MVEKRGQPFYLIELKLYLISKSRAKALDLREERGVGISQRRGPLGRRINEFRRSKRDDAEGLTRPGHKVRRIVAIVAGGGGGGKL